MKKAIIVTKNLKKIYQMGEVQVKALNGVSIKINEGEFIIVAGPSGSGKSTLLHLIGLLDDATSGSIAIDGEEVANLDEKSKNEFRLVRLGYVFQDYALLPELTALENTILPLMQQGIPKDDAKKTGIDILGKVDLADRANHYPSEMSGGQMQRVAIARALASKPKILFADEPTANLDSVSGRQILNLFKKLNKELNQTIVMVSHEPEHLKLVKKVIQLKDGIVAN